MKGSGKLGYDKTSTGITTGAGMSDVNGIGPLFTKACSFKALAALQECLSESRSCVIDNTNRRNKDKN